MKKSRRTGEFTSGFTKAALAVVAGGLVASSAAGQARPNVAVPYGESLSPANDLNAPSFHVPIGASSFGLKAAADNLVSLQCTGGWWDWPYGGCAGTPSNIGGQIVPGLLRAYDITGDSAYVDSATDGGDFYMASTYPNSNPRFATFDAWMFYELSQATGDTTYSDHAANGFFGSLDAGTYGPDSDWDTADWIGVVQDARAGQWINLLPWEFHTIAWAAGQIGQPGQQDLFRDAILDGLNTTDETKYFDLLALAGGVRGLAMIDETSFPALTSPNAPYLQGIDNLTDLTDALLAHQNTNGSWSWRSDVVNAGPAYEDTQVTAYALLALQAAQDAGIGSFSSEIDSARAWLWSVQDGSDGAFFSGGDMTSKNAALQGEAMFAAGVSIDVSLQVDETCLNANDEDEVALTVELNGDMPAAGVVVELDYDASALEYVSHAAGVDFPTEFAFSNNSSTGEILLWVGVDPKEPERTNGELAAFSFKAVSNGSCNDTALFELTEDTRLVFQGQYIYPEGLTSHQPVTIDATGPTVTYADNTLDSTSGVDSGGVLWRYADPTLANGETVVNWDQPVAGIDYSDGCSSSGDITVDIISDFQPGDALLPGETDTVIYRFTDACGNSTDYSFDVHVTETSVLHFSVDYPGLEGGVVERCIEAIVDGSFYDEFTAPFDDGSVSSWSAIPWDTACLQVNDVLHSLKANADLDVDSSGHPRASNGYHSDVTLIGGDLNNDGVIDILDFSVYIWQYGASYGTLDCATAYPHADITGNGIVGIEDFNFVQIHFLEQDDVCSTTIMAGGLHDKRRMKRPSGTKPLTSVTVRELHAMGLGHLAVAELSGDGVVDETDLVMFLQGATP